MSCGRTHRECAKVYEQIIIPVLLSVKQYTGCSGFWINQTFPHSLISCFNLLVFGFNIQVFILDSLFKILKNACKFSYFLISYFKYYLKLIKVLKMSISLLSDFEILALTVWAEARGECEKGQKAVAWVIRNRVDNPRWWGKTIKGVCFKPKNFSCWNKDDSNYKLISDPKTLTLGSYLEILALCEQVFSESAIEDPTNGCDHYATTKAIKDGKVYWARGRKPVIIIGNHSFYQLELNSRRSVS